ncbi:SDR family NAD(P)-dependent oxidoreductase [Thalassospira xiamenensis]|uniref:NAD(P)-dependent dehydrogenase, short-chain alcohol dehydrogenase family n=1 Tax=Thalassospira xiamenensis TaxID=220697 RepID=A0A285TGC2_9PROT|nr:3-oxoacyl-ACP reductase family protein [Thalassospira xiamenensis]SOC21189.1 NAD(P)-dependent dehydrogenase, short-chain alcohol dehydrogenase family [Thalassospira xiamenensis]
MTQLNGKAALVTGGSRGIGAAIAKRLARDGAAVAITYGNAADKAAEVVAEIKEAGGKALAIKADNSDPAAVRAAIEEVAKTFGKIDILVNNAGILSGGSIEDETLESFDRIVGVNIRGVFVAVQAAVKHMPDGGRIITTGSSLANKVPFPGISLYSMTKSALIGFTRGVARDLGPRGITVNLLHPGPTNTDMNPENGENGDTMRSFMAIKQFSRSEDTAGLVSWLASDEGRTVTGAEFTVDSGVNA